MNEITWINVRVALRPSTSTECWLPSHFRVGINVILMSERIMNRILVSLVAVLSITPAFAEDFYVGASFGAYSYEEYGIEISESAIGAYAGWNMRPNLAFEAQLIQWSDGSDSFEYAPGSTATVEITSFDALAVYAKPSLTISEGLGVYAKLGFAKVSVDYEITFVSPCCCPGCFDVNNFTAAESDTDFIWGVGGEYDMSNGFSLRAEVVGFDVADERAFTYLLSAHYRFD